MRWLACARWAAIVAIVIAAAACGPVAAVPTPTALPTASALPERSPSPPAAVTPSPSPSPSQLPTRVPARSITVSLSAQHLWVYEGGTLLASTDVTTGMPALPTPTGTFRIIAMYSPYQFISPWAPGSPYHYEPLWVDYAILFADGGYFIHDAWWQPNFGPGANLKTGSHGCVNVPPAAMPAIFDWARVGDLVVIEN